MTDSTRAPTEASKSAVKRLVIRLRQHALPDPHDEREVLHAPLLKEAADRIEQLEYELGQINIQLDHKTTLLASCEKALEERDAAHYEK